MIRGEAMRSGARTVRANPAPSQPDRSDKCLGHRQEAQVRRFYASKPALVSAFYSDQVATCRNRRCDCAKNFQPASLPTLPPCGLSRQDSVLGGVTQAELVLLAVGRERFRNRLIRYVSRISPVRPSRSRTAGVNRIPTRYRPAIPLREAQPAPFRRVSDFPQTLPSRNPVSLQECCTSGSRHAGARNSREQKSRSYVKAE